MYTLLTTATVYGPLSWTTCVSQYQKKHLPTYTYPDHQSSFISFLHLLQCIVSSLSIYVLDSLFGIPLGLAPSISYSVHCFTQSLSSFHNTCSYQHSLLCCSTEIMSSNPSLCLNWLLGTL